MEYAKRNYKCINMITRRGKYAGFIGGTWGVASVVGPLLGGVRTSLYIRINTDRYFRFSLTMLHGDGVGLLFFLPSICPTYFQSPGFFVNAMTSVGGAHAKAICI